MRAFCLRYFVLEGRKLSCDGFCDITFGADFFDVDAEVFTDFDGGAAADGFVVGHEFKPFFGAFIEFEDSTWREVKDFVQGHTADADLNDEGDIEFEDCFYICCHDSVFIGLLRGRSVALERKTVRG